MRKIVKICLPVVALSCFVQFGFAMDGWEQIDEENQAAERAAAQAAQRRAATHATPATPAAQQQQGQRAEDQRPPRPRPAVSDPVVSTDSHAGAIDPRAPMDLAAILDGKNKLRKVKFVDSPAGAPVAVPARASAAGNVAATAVRPGAELIKRLRERNKKAKKIKFADSPAGAPVAVPARGSAAGNVAVAAVPAAAPAHTPVWEERFPLDQGNRVTRVERVLNAARNEEDADDVNLLEKIAGELRLGNFISSNDIEKVKALEFKYNIN